MAHLIELINSYNDKIMIVNLDNITDVYQYPMGNCRLSLNSVDNDGVQHTIDCIENIQELMCIAEATQPMHGILELLSNLEQERKDYYENLSTLIAKLQTK